MTPQTADLLVSSSDDTVSQESQQTTHVSAAGSRVETAIASQQNQVKYAPAGTGAACWAPETN
jgi:hypothetical protein